MIFQTNTFRSMENKDFAVFILTHGRPDNVITFNTLKKCGYTGRVFFIVDNEDKTVKKYIKNFGEENVKIFNKKLVADLGDEGNNFDERRTITMARNACFYIAKELGITYFIELDDDYPCFLFRINHKKEYPSGNFIIKTKLDNVFDILIDFYKSISAKSIAIAQGGDFIGGGGPDFIYKVKRKCMNSFICSTERPFQFIGAMNEDVNTYTSLGNRGNLFLTIPFLSLLQKETQSQKGGITDMYLRYGTYCKAFTTVMMHPSAVKVSMMNTTNARLHHLIKWGNTTPVIISEKYRKGTGVIEDPDGSNFVELSESILIKYSPEVVEEITDDQLWPEETFEEEVIEEEVKEEYKGEYIVAYSYDIYEKDNCPFNPRFTGTKEQCDNFVNEWKLQKTLF